jgi:ankyrin repeat protein
VKVMIEAKADIHYQDPRGKNALLHAVDEQHTACIMVLLDHGGDGPVSNLANVRALQAVLESKEFSAHEQAATFMLLVHGTDIDAATRNVSKKLLRTVLPLYEHIQLFVDRWHGVALNTLSFRVEVDRRVGLGQHGLYQEPLESVMGYLGLSMGADQVVNSSLDNNDDVQRVLLPNCAHNANHWFLLHKQKKEKAAAARA